MSGKNPMIFASDCEGPISKNDNAFELAEHFISEGGIFFALISKYDDVLADVIEKPGYKPGDTLKLILPFLKAYGATDEGIREYCLKNILLVPGADDTLRFVKEAMPSYIISTSYEQYLSSLCDLIGFPYANVYCTRLNLNKYEVSEEEINQIKVFKEEITAMPMIEISPDAASVDNFSSRDQKTVKRLDEIFWREIPKMKSGRMLEEVNPIGGYEKANALKDIVSKLNCRLDNVMYVGDSITDVSPYQLVRESGGLTVSFNGNEYAVREAEVAVISGNTIPVTILADCFNRFGKHPTIKLVEEWSRSALGNYCANTELHRRIFELYPENLPQVEVIKDSNRERLVKESSAFRKTVRGEAIGKLG
jgi:energy-converting hydrogenase A subunit R